MLYKIFWQHKDFPKHSEGPILRHSKRGATIFGKPYTKEDARKLCIRLNLKQNKGNLVRHWVREVLI